MGYYSADDSAGNSVENSAVRMVVDSVDYWVGVWAATKVVRMADCWVENWVVLLAENLVVMLVPQ